MVTKQFAEFKAHVLGSVLAKILMVTKHSDGTYQIKSRSVLAKILMVTKQSLYLMLFSISSVLAKILMVTKRIMG